MEIERVGGWLVVVDRDGVRHALRPGALLAACEMPDQDATLILLPGGKMIVLPAPLDETLQALSL